MENKHTLCQTFKDPRAVAVSGVTWNRVSFFQGENTLESLLFSILLIFYLIHICIYSFSPRPDSCLTLSCLKVTLCFLCKAHHGLLMLRNNRQALEELKYYCENEEIIITTWKYKEVSKLSCKSGRPFMELIFSDSQCKSLKKPHISGLK